MAHIDSISHLDRSVRRHFLKVFNRLNEQFFIRQPLLDEVNIAPIIIEASHYSWLMLGWHEEQPTVESLQRLIDFNQALTTKQFQAIPYLAIVKNAPTLFDRPYNFPNEIILIEQQTFFASGETHILQNLVELSEEQHARIKKTLFSELVIHSQCTTKRKVVMHNNTAIFQPFFLDYDQEQATRFDMLTRDEQEENNPLQEELAVRLINGVAGSGKTLILLNRALLFCKKYPEKQVLLVIHNKPVTTDIQYRIQKWLGGKPKNLIIETFHAFALKQKNRAAKSKYITPLFTEKNLAQYKQQILNPQHESYRVLTLSDEQIWDEIEYINNYLIKNLDEYIHYERSGRGFSLQKTQRTAIWQLYEQAMSIMANTHGYLPSLYIREIALAEEAKIRKYDHILVDEAQFFAPSWLQLLRQSLNHHGNLFLCADPNQGFLKHRLSWKSIGFNVRGRTKKLQYSYRTTYEIMLAANALLGILDEHSEDFIKPELTRMEHGQLPQLVYSPTSQDELQRFINELKQCVADNHIPLHQIMVLCNDNYNPWQLKPIIEKAIGQGRVVNCNDREDLQRNLGDKIRLMSINSCTGMESGVTFVLGIGELLNQADNLDLEDSEREVAYSTSIRKLYVCMTRAGQKLVLFSTQKIPDCMQPFVNITGTALA